MVLIEFFDPPVDIRLKLAQVSVESLAENHAVQFVDDCLVEALADAVNLRGPHLGLVMLNLLEAKI